MLHLVVARSAAPLRVAAKPPQRSVSAASIGAGAGAKQRCAPRQIFTLACRCPQQWLPQRGFSTATEDAVPQRCGAITLSSADPKFMGTPFAQRVFSALRLKTFSESELRDVFKAVDRGGSGLLERPDVFEVMHRAHLGRVRETDLDRRAEQMTSAVMSRLDRDGDNRISFDEFQAGILDMAEQRDERMWPIAGSMLFAGIAVGVVLPAMPLLVQQLGLTQAQFGTVVSAFGLSKLLANLPAGIFLDWQGRRAAMVGGLVVVGFGTIGVGLCQSLEEFIAARFATGIGACFIMAGATMAVTDISTPLNRARMLAPVMTAFSAGTVLGPAMGGSMIGSLGLAPTLSLVGGLFFLNAVGTRCLVPETRPTVSQQNSLPALVRLTLAQWRPLLGNGELRAALAVNAAYWVALAGGNMTLLPLMLAGQFGLSPAEIGMTFASQGAVSVLAAGPLASLADRIGPEQLLAPGLCLMALSMGMLPLAPDMWWAAGPLAVMSIGSTALSSAPTALTANLVAPQSRTQALALMRTIGDVGWLAGGLSVGAFATIVGTSTAMQGTASTIFLTAAWFAARHALKRRSSLPRQ